MVETEARARSAAPPERVWALLADARTWPGWAGFDSAEVESGVGLGEVRRIRSGRVRSRERVTAFEPPRRFGYAFLEGLPVRDYTGEVTLDPSGDGGTEIHWRASFRPRYPGSGWLLRRGIARFLSRLAEGLARAAETAK